jgi:PKD domain/PQQ-like domain
MPHLMTHAKPRLLRVATVVLSAAVALLAPNGPATAACNPGPSCLDDTAAWPMLGHDLRHTGQSPNLGPLGADDVKIWTGLDRVKSSPAIAADGTIYVAVGWALCAIDPVTMTTKPGWFTPGTPGCKVKLGADVSSSSPAIARNADGTSETIIVGDRGNTVNAFDPAGNLLWKYVHGREGDVKASAAVGPDGTIYIAFTGNYDGIGVVTALNPADQQLDGKGPSKWHFTIGTSVNASSPAYHNGFIYVGSMNGELNAFVADGSGAGSPPLPPGTRKWHTKLGTRINASPVIGPDGTLYVGSTSAFYALDPVDGSILWTFPTNGEVDQTAALSTGGTLYFGAKLGKLKTFYALTSDGHLKWKKEFPLVDSDKAAFPAIGSDGVVYAGIGKSVYAFGSGGTELWRYPTNAPIMSFPAIGPLKDGRAVLYVPSGDHKVYAISSPRSGGGSNQPPYDVDAGPNQSGNPDDVFSFTGSAKDPDGDALTYKWDFGDCPTHPLGCTATGKMVTRIYVAEGQYIVTLTVKDGHAHTVTDTLTVSVGQSGGTTTFKDLFDRVDSSTLGNGWLEAVRGLKISGGKLCNDLGAGDHIAVQPALSGGDQSARADFASTGYVPNPRFGIVLRFQNASNYYVLYRQAGNLSQLRIAKVVSGEETILKQVAVLNPGLNVPFMLTGLVENLVGSTGPTLTLHLNGGTKTISVIDTSTPFANGVPGILLGAGTSNTGVYCADNFFTPEDQ